MTFHRSKRCINVENPSLRGFFTQKLWKTLWKVWMKAVFMHRIYGHDYEFHTDFEFFPL